MTNYFFRLFPILFLAHALIAHADSTIILPGVQVLGVAYQIQKPGILELSPIQFQALTPEQGHELEVSTSLLDDTDPCKKVKKHLTRLNSDETPKNCTLTRVIPYQFTWFLGGIDTHVERTRIDYSISSQSVFPGAYALSQKQSSHFSYDQNFGNRLFLGGAGIHPLWSLGGRVALLWKAGLELTSASYDWGYSKEGYEVEQFVNPNHTVDAYETDLSQPDIKDSDHHWQLKHHEGVGIGFHSLSECYVYGLVQKSTTLQKSMDSRISFRNGDQIKSGTEAGLFCFTQGTAASLSALRESYRDENKDNNRITWGPQATLYTKNFTFQGKIQKGTRDSHQFEIFETFATRVKVKNLEGAALYRIQKLGGLTLGLSGELTQEKTVLNSPFHDELGATLEDTEYRFKDQYTSWSVGLRVIVPAQLILNKIR